MTEETPFDADEREIAERRPTNCPFCGHDGAFDGQGHVPDTIKLIRRGVEREFDATWYGVRCSECDGYFRMLEEVEEIDA